MKRFQMVLCLLFMYAMLSSPSYAVTTKLEAVHLQTIRIAAFNFYPAIFQAEDGSVQGFYVDFLKEIAKREGWKIEYVYGTWADGLSKIKTGEVDLLTNVAFTQERALFLDFGKSPLLTVWAELYVPNSSNIDTIRQVKGKKIALMKGDFNAANFRNLVEKFNIPCEYIEYGSFEDVFEALSTQQVDGGVVNNTFGASKQHEYSNIKSSGVIFNPFDIYFAVAKGKNRKTIDTLDKYLTEWRKYESSPYHQARERWAHGSASTIPVTPAWLRRSIVFLLISSCVAIAFIIILRVQVRRKTAELKLEINERTKTTDELHATAFQLQNELSERELAQESLQKQAKLLEEQIKKRSIVEGTLRVEKELSDKYLNIAQVIMVAFDDQARVTLINKKGYEVLGYKEGELTGRDWFQICLPPEEYEPVFAAYKRLMAGELNSVEYFENFILTKEGKRLLIAWRNTVMRDENGCIIGTLSSGEDITEQRLVEQERKEHIHFLECMELINNTIRQERDVEQLLQDVVEIVFTTFKCDRAWLFYPCDPNAQFFQIPVEISRPEYPGSSTPGVDIPMPPSVAKDLRDALASENPLTYVLDSDSPVNEFTAQYFAVQSQIFQAIYPKVGKPWVFGMHQCSHPRIWTNYERMLFKEIGHRVTDGLNSVLFLRDLKESEERFSTLVNQAVDAFFLHDTEGWLLDVNQKACENLGFTREELLAMNVTDLEQCQDSDKFDKNIWSELNPGCPVTFEGMHKRKDGTTFPVEVRLGSLLIKERKVILALARDTTDRKHLEEQLRQSQKIEAIGQLAGGVAHDFNNILQVIAGYGALLKMDHLLGLNEQNAVDQILSAADKAARLTRGLLAFSRKQVMTLIPINLNDIVKNVTDFLVRTIGEDIQLNITTYPKGLTIFADKGQIEQVLINLATNARDAIQKSGLVTIETGLQEVETPTSHESGGFGKTRYAVISVSDNGSGMDEETRTKIFEPFFTTKEVGKGTGLGLAIVYGIIQQHKGYIKVHSELGHGTTFRIFIPIYEIEHSGQRDTTNQAVIPQGGPETILLAEDDAGVRKLVVTLLSRLGYNVIQAVDGQDAVDKFSANKDGIHMILMDMIMPKKNGTAAYEEICMLQPGVKIVYLSGYTADFIQSRGVSEEGIELIMKPVQPQELLRKVRETLDSK